MTITPATTVTEGLAAQQAGWQKKAASTAMRPATPLAWSDMHAKYADVVPEAEILAYFNQLPTNLFDLPTGNRSSAPQIKEAAE
jgi:hypothetical protein